MNEQHVEALSQIFIKDESLKDMTSKINQISNEKVNLQKQVSQLSTTIEQGTKQLQQSHQREQQLQGQNQALQNRIQVGIHQLSQAKGQIEQGNKQVQQMRNTISNMTSQQQQQMAQQQMMNIQNQKLSQQLEQVRNTHRQAIRDERKKIEIMLSDMKSSHISDDDSKETDDIDMSEKTRMKKDFQLKVATYENMFENSVPNDVREHYNHVIQENKGKIDDMDRIRLIKQHIYAHQRRIQGLVERRMRFLKMYQGTEYAKQLEQVWKQSNVENILGKEWTQGYKYVNQFFDWVAHNSNDITQKIVSIASQPKQQEKENQNQNQSLLQDKTLNSSQQTKLKEINDRLRKIYDLHYDDDGISSLINDDIVATSERFTKMGMNNDEILAQIRNKVKIFEDQEKEIQKLSDEFDGLYDEYERGVLLDELNKNPFVDIDTKATEIYRTERNFFKKYIKLARDGKKPNSVKQSDENDKKVEKNIKSLSKKDIEIQYFKGKKMNEKGIKSKYNTVRKNFPQSSRKASIIERALLEVSRWERDRQGVLMELGIR